MQVTSLKYENRTLKVFCIKNVISTYFNEDIYFKTETGDFIIPFLALIIQISHLVSVIKSLTLFIKYMPLLWHILLI